MECEDRSMAGNEMCYLGEMLAGGCGGVGVGGLVLFSSQSLHCGAISIQGYKACLQKEQEGGEKLGA